MINLGFLRPALFLVFLAFVLITSNAKASCSALSDLDELYDGNGGFVFYFGCDEGPYDELPESYKQWPLSLQRILADYYFIKEIGPYTPLKADEYLEPTGNDFADLLLTIHLSASGASKKALEILNSRFKSLDLPQRYADKVAALMTFDTEQFDQEFSLSTSNTLKILGSSEEPFLQSRYIMAKILGWKVAEDAAVALELLKLNQDKTFAIYEIVSKYHHDIEALNDVDLENFIGVLLKANHKNEQLFYKYAIADRYYYGDFGFEKNGLEAAKLFERLAIYGVPSAQYSLAYQYLDGYGVSEDKDLALEWMDTAARNQFRFAIEEMVYHYSEIGDARNTLLYSLLLAELGAINLRDGGYELSNILSNDIGWSSSTVQKFKEYLEYHCKNNPFVNKRDDCKFSDYGKDFLEVIRLENAFNEPSRLSYANELRLKTGKFKALMIANENYSDWEKLETPKNDVISISKQLVNLGFEVETIFDASRREILKAIYDSAKDLNFSDHFLIYYAGHGVVDQRTDVAYWIPADANRDFIPDWVSSAEIKNSLKSVLAKHILLIADSCYSGKLLRGGSEKKEISNAMIERLFFKKARVAITSGGDEPVLDSIGGSENSVFAAALISALSEIDTPTPASKLFENILGEVSVKANQTPQYADMRELDHDGGDFIFVPKQHTN